MIPLANLRSTVPIVIAMPRQVLQAIGHSRYYGSVRQTFKSFYSFPFRLFPQKRSKAPPTQETKSSQHTKNDLSH